MKMVHGLKTLLSRLSFLLIFLISFSLSAKTLKVDTVTPSVTNGDFTITPNGTGDIVLGTFSGVLKSSTGVVSVGNVNLTSEVTGTLPEANGGTGVADMATILVEILGTQTISGVKTFSSDILMSGTGQIDIPVGTTAQRSGSPNTGMIRYNSDTSSYEGYAGTDWAALGGGGGGSLLNLIIDPSFETGVTEGTCTTCTASSEATVVELTDLNTKSLKMAFSASAGDYTDTTTTSSQYTGVVGKASARCKTDQEGIEFCSMVDGAESACVAVRSDDIWDTYAINSTMSSTSFGYKIVARNSITGNVYCDEIFAGSNPIETVVTQGLTEQYRTDDALGYSSSNTAIPYYRTTPIFSSISKTGTIENSTTLGWSFTATQRCLVVLSVAHSDTTDVIVGVTLNSTQLTTEIQSVTDGSILSAHYQSAVDHPAHVTASWVMEVGDVIRPHVGGQSTVTALDHRHALSFTATPQSNKAVMVSVDDDSMTDWVDYTPTSQGIGTPTITKARWRKIGDSLELDVDLITGTVTAVEFQLGFPSGLVADSSIGANEVKGLWQRNANTDSHLSALVSGGESVVKVGARGGGVATLKSTYVGSGIAGSTEVWTLKAKIKIVGWSATPTAMIAVPVIMDRAGDNWTSFTPTGAWTTNTAYSGQWKRDADDMLVAVEVATSGAPTAAALTVNLPSGYTIDTAKLSGGTTDGSRIIRDAVVSVLDNGAAQFTGTVHWSDTSSVILKMAQASSTYTQSVNITNLVPHTFAANDKVWAEFRVPIVGWTKEKDVFLGNVNPTEFVKTPSSVKPVIYSAKIDTNSGTPTLIKEIGTWITSFTDNGVGNTTLNLGAVFSEYPICTCSANDLNNAVCYASGLTATTVQVVTQTGTSAGAGDYDFNVICHGVQ